MPTVNTPKKLFNLLTEREIKIFDELQNILAKLNKSTNLTRLIDNDDYWISQVYDSIWPFYEKKDFNFDKKKCIDIGSGCGFPGLAYAITHRNSEVYLIDSSKKKTDALQKIINKINIENNINVINRRIEDCAYEKIYRNKFDLATVRAVGSPPTVAEYLLPLLNQTGMGILFCGKWDQRETIKLNKALSFLQGEIVDIKQTSLPKNKGERNVIFIKPVIKCKAIYPRGNGKPKKHPLGN